MARDWLNRNRLIRNLPEVAHALGLSRNRVLREIRTLERTVHARQVRGALAGTSITLPGLEASGTLLAIDGLSPNDFLAGTGKILAPAISTQRRTLTVVWQDSALAPVGGIAQHAARWADQLVDSFGANIRLPYTSTAYTGAPSGSFDNVIKPKLVELRVRHLRDIGRVQFTGAYGSAPVSAYMNPLYLTRMKQVAELPTRPRFLLVGEVPLINAGPTSAHVYDQYPDTIFSYLERDWVEAWEGLNEWDNQTGRATRWTEMRTFQEALLAAFARNPGWEDMLVLGPSFAGRDEGALPGDLSALMHRANIHPYPGGDQPLHFLQACLDNVVLNSPGLVVWAGEMGYHTTPNSTHGHNWNSEAAQGKNWSRVPFEFLAAGIERTYAHELIDYKVDVNNATDIQQHFGLLRNNGDEKPAFTVLKRLMALFDDQGRVPTPTPAPVPYTISGTVSHMPFRTRDGRILIALWQAVKCFTTTGATSTDIVTPDENATLTFPAHSTMRLHRPYTTGTPGSWIHDDEITVAVPDHVVVLELL